MGGANTKTVLVVDDEESIRDIVTQTLEFEGYQVREAEDGAQALQMVGRSLPDLVLLDMKMPVMNGWEFATQFRARYDRLAPIVVITASDSAAERAKEIDAEGWIGKPFDIDRLVEIVNRHLQ